MTSASPYLSVVATSRNDDHGGDLLRRMQIFVDGFIAQCRRHELAAELILVEWNPPAGRPRLVDALRWPDDTAPCRVRIITVPERIHRRFRHARRLPLFQMIAKNVGVRRARGQFILATNIDVLFSDELMAHIAARRLEPGCIYRIDRLDIRAGVPMPATVDQQLAYCRANLIRTNAREGTFRLTPDGEPQLSTPDAVSPSLGIRFGSGWYAPETACEGTFRWASNDAVLLVQGAAHLPRALSLEIEPGPGVGRSPCVLEVRDEQGRPIARGTIRKRQLVSFRLPPPAYAVERYTLHVVNGGRPTPNDWRTLNFRLFDCQRPEDWNTVVAVDAPANFRVECGQPPPQGVVEPHDIVAPEAGLRFGPGWHAVEERSGSRFRWAGDDAVLVVHPPVAEDVMTLAIEPGPGVGYRPFELQVLDEGGQPVARTAVAGGSLTTLRLPLAPRATQRFTFHVDNGGQPAPRDARILNYRVFHPIQPGRPVMPFHWRLLAKRLLRGVAPCLKDVLAKVAHWRQRQRLGLSLPAGAEFPEAIAPGESSVSPVALHLNASGDFTLLDREHWFELHGYPELQTYSLHIDSVFCYMAHHAGCREVVLPEPLRLYHIEHSAGSGWTPEGEHHLMDRLSAQGIPVLSPGELMHWATVMRRRKAPLIFNDVRWGLRDEHLLEVTPAGSGPCPTPTREDAPCEYR